MALQPMIILYSENFKSRTYSSEVSYKIDKSSLNNLKDLNIVIETHHILWNIIGHK